MAGEDRTRFVTESAVAPAVGRRMAPEEGHVLIPGEHVTLRSKGAGECGRIKDLSRGGLSWFI